MKDKKVKKIVSDLKDLSSKVKAGRQSHKELDRLNEEFAVIVHLDEMNQLTPIDLNFNSDK